MNLNRHNPFVAALSTLVEPAPAMPVGAPVAAPAAPAADPAAHPTLIERIESLAALGQTHGGAPEAPAGELPDAAAIDAQTYRLYPYYY
jgi:hypothetical protein